MSYTIDVYRRRCDAADSLLEMATYISFFPLLLAGPIERGSHLLPQFQRARRIGLADWREGIWLITWGLYKKIVVADNLARLVNATFAPFSTAGASIVAPDDGIRLLLILYAYALQIYCDFSGYTDVARGVARLLGFDIMLNFNFPYLARNPSDFWRRWHISLSSWLRDYLYIPLGGNRHGTVRTYRNLMVTMVLGGLWHGAAWTFVLWGAFHGLLLVVYRALSGVTEKLSLLWGGLWARPGSSAIRAAAQSSWAASDPQVATDPPWRFLGADRSAGSPSGTLGKSESKVIERENRNIYVSFGIAVAEIVIMFNIVCIGWLLFRAQNLATVGAFLHSIVLHPHWSPGAAEALQGLVFYGWFFVLLELLWVWKGASRPFGTWPWFARLNVWLVVLMSLLALAAKGTQEFIYFAF